MPFQKTGPTGPRQLLNEWISPMLIFFVPSSLCLLALVLAPQHPLSNHHVPDPVAVVAARRQTL